MRDSVIVARFERFRGLSLGPELRAMFIVTAARAVELKAAIERIAETLGYFMAVVFAEKV
jgi:hypothetical protein